VAAYRTSVVVARPARRCGARSGVRGGRDDTARLASSDVIVLLVPGLLIEHPIPSARVAGEVAVTAGTIIILVSQFVMAWGRASRSSASALLVFLGRGRVFLGRGRVFLGRDCGHFGAEVGLPCLAAGSPSADVEELFVQLSKISTEKHESCHL